MTKKIFMKTAGGGGFPRLARVMTCLMLMLTGLGTGAWAQEESLLTTITPTGNATYSETTAGVVTVTLSNVRRYIADFGWLWGGSGSVTVEAKEGYTITRCVFKQNSKTPVTITTSPFAITFNERGQCEQNDDMDGVTSIEVYGNAPATGYSVTLKDDTEDADNWTVKVGDGGTAQALPVEGLSEGETVTVTYTGAKKVIGVKAEKKASAPSLNITNPVVGQVIGSDGKNYAYGSLPTGVTAVAKICYVSGSNGLALALTDEEGTKDWSTAQTTCAAHTPAFTGGTWKLATKDEWSNMISAAGSYTDLRDGFSSVGGTNMNPYYYWSSTEFNSDLAWDNDFDECEWSADGKGNVDYVRACLAF